MDDGILSVVLVEDDEDYAALYRLRLEQDGYRVSIAPNGEAGLELIKRTDPDLVYLDIRMPTLDGITVLRQLRADSSTAKIPVVVLSNYDEPELVSQGLELGVLEWLVKAEITPTTLAQRTIALLKR
jgi:DNA-binding response OmpR family regulator